MYQRWLFHDGLLRPWWQVDTQWEDIAFFFFIFCLKEMNVPTVSHPGEWLTMGQKVRKRCMPSWCWRMQNYRAHHGHSYSNCITWSSSDGKRIKAVKFTGQRGEKSQQVPCERVDPWEVEANHDPEGESKLEEKSLAVTQDCLLRFATGQPW